MSPLRVTTKVPVSACAPDTVRSTSFAEASVTSTVTTCVSSSYRFTVAVLAVESTT